MTKSETKQMAEYAFIEMAAEIKSPEVIDKLWKKRRRLIQALTDAILKWEEMV